MRSLARASSARRCARWLGRTAIVPSGPAGAQALPPRARFGLKSASVSRASAPAARFPNKVCRESSGAFAFSSCRGPPKT